MNSNEPIRVAQIMGKLWAGGVEAVVFNYYRAIDKSKVQFDFYYDADSTVEPPQELIDMGAHFIEIPSYQKLPLYLKALRKCFKENNYKIVHSHINTLSVFPLFAAWTRGIPVRIAHNHSVPGGNEFKSNVLKYFLRLFAKTFSTDYFACSEKAGRWMFGDKFFDQGRVFVVKNAVDFDRFRPRQSDVDKLKNNLGIEDKFVIGHVGRFTYAKNHMFLLDVFNKISMENENARLMLVGDGELHDAIHQKVKEKKSENKVVFIGQVNNPEKYYRLADVMVIPSIFEGLSLTTIESQIAGIPVVVSESIPDETIISNACVHVSLNKSIDTWIEIIKKTSNIEVELNNMSNEYEINSRSKILTNWYMNR